MPNNTHDDQLQTVTGLVAVDEITMVDGHAHAWIHPPEGVLPKYRLVLNNPQRIEAELRDFRSAGGAMLVDCQPGGCGRDARMLVKFSEATGLHLTATTGFHLQHYYPRDYWLWSANEQAAADYFINELTTGVQEKDDVLATTIKVGYPGEIKEQTRVLMEAAAEAARQTGAALLFHTEQGRGVEDLPLFFEDRGVAINRLYLCHIDKRPDLGLHQELAQAGALLGYDTFVRAKYKPAQNVWPLLGEMIRSGREDNIAIGLDLAQTALWHHFEGSPGLVTLPDKILPQLHQAGYSESVVSKLIAKNVARFLVRRQKKNKA